jgi:hypothetical protein
MTATSEDPPEPVDHQQPAVRDARVCQGRQGHLLLPKRGQVQIKYATFGFNADANIDEGTMWPTSFALTEFDRRQRGEDQRS